MSRSRSGRATLSPPSNNWSPSRRRERPAAGGPRSAPLSPASCEAAPTAGCRADAAKTSPACGRDGLMDVMDWHAGMRPLTLDGRRSCASWPRLFLDECPKLLVRAPRRARRRCRGLRLGRPYAQGLGRHLRRQRAATPPQQLESILGQDELGRSRRDDRRVWKRRLRSAGRRDGANTPGTLEHPETDVMERHQPAT